MRRMRHLKPREIQGCQLALDASIPTSLYDAPSGGSLVAADGAVARWEDQSGVGRHVTQGSSANRPLLRAAGINGRASVDFDGSNDTLTRSAQQITDFFNSNQSILTIVVQTQDAATVYNASFYIASNTYNRLSFFATYGNIIYSDITSVNAGGRLYVTQPAGWDDAPQVLAFARSGSNGYIVANNITIATKSDYSDSASSASLTMSIGSGDSCYHGGQIAEINIWAISPSEFLAKRAWNSRQRKWRING